MDEFTLRLSELENQAEELEKLTGKLTVQLRSTEEKLAQAMRLIETMQDTNRAICDAQKTMHGELRTVQRHLDALTERIAQLDETADELEDGRSSADAKIRELSGDIDQLYEDMNVLSAETRTRVHAMNQKMTRFFFDMTGSDYKPDEPEPEAPPKPKGDTMW